MTRGPNRLRTRSVLSSTAMAAFFVLVVSAKAQATPGTVFTPLPAGQLVFVNVDHAPVSALSTLAYGAKSDRCGLGMTSASIPNGGGMLVALKSASGLQAMPFMISPTSIDPAARFFPDNQVQRELGPCTDQWTLANGAVSWTHCTPAWSLPNLANAELAEKRRFFLPATWMVFTIRNTTSQPEDFYFGLPIPAAQKTFCAGACEGFAIQEAAMAVKTGSCELLSGTTLTKALGGLTKGFAFHLRIPAGRTQNLIVVVAYYRGENVDTRIPAGLYYKTVFGSIDDVIAAAMDLLPAAQAQCASMGKVMDKSGINPFRRFLASDTLHSYQACTLCLSDAKGNVYWREMEGAYQYINTFDLTVDHAFYDAMMSPWALRNVLDTMSGASNGTGYSYDRPLFDPVSKAHVSSTGFSFHHDMGRGLTSEAPGVAAVSYEIGGSFMGQEQLQNWILCAGVYWKATSDDGWLKQNLAMLKTCLKSMELRDGLTLEERNGITKYVNMRDRTINPKLAAKDEITTYDSLDASLKQPNLSARTTVRSWASYLALQAMFTQLGDSTDAATARDLAGKCAATIVDRWNKYDKTLGYIPAFLDGSNTAATIPILEGLAYVDRMGLDDALDMTKGPYAEMLRDLRSHTVNILVPGRCLDAATGGWKLTSSTTNTWQSKVYLSQYVAEKILGITGDTVDGKVDQVHATFQMIEAPVQGWSDQFDSRGIGLATQSLHYPRGITSSLWWLTPATVPPFPD